MVENEITPEEIEIYTNKLIPKLARYPPGQWIKISDIAHNVERFIFICQHLANVGALDNKDGYLQVEICKDSLVRLDPYVLTKEQLQKDSPYDRKTQRKKQGSL